MSAAEPPAELILASTSPYRRMLLDRLGWPFRCVAPECDDAAIQAEMSGSEPSRIAEELALRKATSPPVANLGGTAIGCDQLVSFEGRLFGKPGSLDRAIDQLETMSGRTHELITAMIVVRGDRMFRRTDVTRLRMRSLSREAIERYVWADRPMDCAGSYKLESRGIALFDRIESEDHTAITGLPMIALTSILRDLGYPIP